MSNLKQVLLWYPYFFFLFFFSSSFSSSVRFVQFKFSRSIMAKKNMGQEPCYTMLCIIIFAFVKYVCWNMGDIY